MAWRSSAGRPPRRHPDPAPELGPHFLVEVPPGAVGSPTSLAAVRLRPDEVTTLEMGSTSVTFLGVCLADEPELRRRCARAVRRNRLADVTDLPGSFHAIVSSPSVLAIFGDVAGLRRIFYTRIDGAWLVSDRADVLARRVDAPLDDRWLALWLVWPPPEIPASATPWEGVDAVPPGGCLVWRRDQDEPQVEIYWTPPRPDVALEDGAICLARALTVAVQERVWRAASPSLDLSGGKDTVALAFLADEATRNRLPASAAARIVAVTLPSISPDNDDMAWARAAAGHLTTVDHVVIPVNGCPLPYDDLDDERLGTDHPSVATMHSARRRHVAERLRERGCGGSHVSGHGGDEVLQAPVTYLSPLLRQRPWLGLGRLRRHCALTGAAIGPALRATLLPGSYAQWLRRAASDVAARRRKGRHIDGFGWGVMTPPPPWLTGRALQLAAEALDRAGTTCPSPSGDIATHTALARIRSGATTARLQQQFLAPLGVRMECPYLDRRVVDSALAVRPHERTNPSVFKPLLDAAMGSTVPAWLRARPTKGHYTEDTAWGLRRNRRRILRYVATARLAERGLVDADVLRRAAEHPDGMGGSLLAVTDALSCERWLRSLEVAA